MELKPYQQQILADLQRFMHYVQETKNAADAFQDFWFNHPRTPLTPFPGEAVEPYKNNVAKAPHVCIKVPTGGGDTVLTDFMVEQLGLVRLDFVRYKYDLIDWNLRMVGLVGPRGVGKSTLVLQHILRQKEMQKALYVSADRSYFAQHTLVEVANEFVKEGGTHLYIDEIHKYPSWSTELKEIYDGHPLLHIVFTGSSVLDLLRGQADLSRRAVMYSMQGLSFREYLELFHQIKMPVYSIDEVIANKVNSTLVPHPLPLFRDYLREGYYPFSKDGAFFSRLDQIVVQTLESDILQYASMSVSTGRKLRRLMGIVAKSAPFKPDYSSIATYRVPRPA